MTIRSANDQQISNPKGSRGALSRRRQSTVYLPEDLQIRLGRYQADKLKGLGHQRNRVICEALDRFLIANGY
jgi:hypothetical protein